MKSRHPAGQSYQTSLAGLYLTGSLCGKGVDFVIDTGSSTTIVSQSVLASIPEVRRPELNKTSDKFVMADGRTLPVKGRAKVEIMFGHMPVNHDVLEADIEADGLIGLDFLKAHDGHLDYKKGCLEVKGEALKFREEPGQNTTCFVQVAKTVIIPTLSENVVGGILNSHGRSPECGVVEPADSFTDKSGLLLGRTLVSTKDKHVPLRVMNPSSEPKRLYKGMNAAILCPIVEVVNDYIPSAHGVRATQGTTDP